MPPKFETYRSGQPSLSKSAAATPLVKPGRSHAGARRDVFERAVALVQEQLRRAVLVADEQIDEPVVVDVGPDRGLRARRGPGQPACDGDVGERAVAVVPQQRLALRRPSRRRAARGCRGSRRCCSRPAGCSSRQAVRPGRGATPCSRTVPSSSRWKKRMRRAAVDARRHDIEPAVAVEVVDDDAAGRAIQIQAGLGATSTKRPTSSADANAAGGIRCAGGTRPGTRR